MDDSLQRLSILTATRPAEKSAGEAGEKPADPYGH
jgi:hypothetical protein